MLTLYNSLTRQMSSFTPSDPNHVTMYVCGPTVYDTPHIGNVRPVVVFDVLYRLLKEQWPTEYVRNFTDIDDKIIERAAKNGETIRALTNRTIDEFLDVTGQLGCLTPDHMPRATEFIPSMVDTICVLIDKQHAYQADGHVLFSTSSFPGHGRLSGHELASLKAGHRVEVASFKRDQNDFVLWKPSSDEQPGWDSPWGRGRPGWHIECSAMIHEVLGTVIDIHGGGADLRFPHHECEISQSTCAFGQMPARHWLHNGMVLVNGKKMAKSAGNFITPRSLMTRGVPTTAIRLSLLSAHYRSPLDWSDKITDMAETMLARLRNSLVPFGDREAIRNEFAAPVIDALYGDLNTPLAITKMNAMIKQLNTTKDVRIAEALFYVMNLLGISREETSVLDTFTEIQAMVDERSQARKRRDFVQADRLRDELNALGVFLRDEEDTTVWWRD